MMKKYNTNKAPAPKEVDTKKVEDMEEILKNVGHNKPTAKDFYKPIENKTKH